MFIDFKSRPFPPQLGQIVPVADVVYVPQLAMMMLVPGRDWQPFLNRSIQIHQDGLRRSLATDDQLRFMPCDIDDLFELPGIGPGPFQILLKINAADFLLAGDDRINELVSVRNNEVPYFSCRRVLPDDFSTLVYSGQLELHIVTDHQLVRMFLELRHIATGVARRLRLFLGHRRDACQAQYGDGEANRVQEFPS